MKGSMDDAERLEKGQILGKAIIEMLGTPQAHVEDSMTKFLEVLDTSEVLYVLKKEIAPAQKQDGEGKLFSIFAELEIWFKDIPSLVDFCFQAMPSSIDILQPTLFNMNAAEITGILNLLQTRVHEADAVVKNAKLKYQTLDAKSLVIFRNFIKYILSEGPKTLEELSKPTGVDPDQLRPFVDKLIQAKDVTFHDEDKTYHLASQSK